VCLPQQEAASAFPPVFSSFAKDVARPLISQGVRNATRKKGTRSPFFRILRTNYWRA